MKLYTDGAATMRKINGEYVREAGGWAFAFINDDNKMICSHSGHLEQTTNQAMELIAIYEGLKYYKEHFAPAQQLEICSDSAYCINIYTQWIEGWRKNGWIRKGNKPIENLEVIKATWKLLQELNESFSEIKFVKVIGHSDDIWNNYVDQLAVEAKLDYPARGMTKD
jgi:ribonuclease HI